jgi:hypothetical protein
VSQNAQRVHLDRNALAAGSRGDAIPAMRRARGRTKCTFGAQNICHPTARSCRVRRLGPLLRPQSGRGKSRRRPRRGTVGAWAPQGGNPQFPAIMWPVTPPMRGASFLDTGPIEFASRRFRHTSPTKGPLFRGPSLNPSLGLGLPSIDNFGVLGLIAGPRVSRTPSATRVAGGLCQKLCFVSR